ncbi:Uncharacterised protein [Mycobacteroides abscessus subsp. abscessus]|nr:Uncharacterised protein [Mycobacteroides abscessus subsp. abscessus]
MKSRGLPIRSSALSTQMLAIFSARAGMKPWKPRRLPSPEKVGSTCTRRGRYG